MSSSKPEPVEDDVVDIDDSDDENVFAKPAEEE